MRCPCPGPGLHRHDSGHAPHSPPGLCGVHSQSKPHPPTARWTDSVSCQPFSLPQHVVQGKMGFAPMFFRLNEGCTEMTWAGFWETLTYGLLGMYKSDWDTSRGFNIDKYTTKWGGEDWDAVDRSAVGASSLADC